MVAASLVPFPASVRTNAAEPPFRLVAGTAVTGPSTAAAELARLVEVRTGVALRIGGSPASAAGTIALAVDGAGVPESYRLSVTAERVQLAGADAAGLFYGVQTLVQLLEPGAVSAGSGSGSIPAVRVEDAPRFPYRGVMLDLARHFLGAAAVRAYVDRAGSLKFNHLHLHLSDDQGWRLALRTRPELTARASATAVGGDAGGFLTRDDYLELVAYAAARHMTVVPEFDVPGHTHAVGLAYPELAADPVASDEVVAAVEEFGGGMPVAGEPYTGIAVGFSSLRIHEPRTYDFLADVFGELAELTPGPYLHLGGDEALGTSRDDYAEAIRRTAAIVAATGKTPVAWHEARAVEGLPGDLVAQFWGYTGGAADHADAVRGIVASGGRVILSPADAAYLDMKPHADSPLGLAWADGPTSLEAAYSWEPADVLPGVDPDRILGVEAPLWTETVRTLDDVDALAFPRIAAIAEIAWSPAPGAATERTWASFRGRVGGLGRTWAALGFAVPAPPGPHG